MQRIAFKCIFHLEVRIIAISYENRQKDDEGKSFDVYMSLMGQGGSGSEDVARTPLAKQSL